MTWSIIGTWAMCREGVEVGIDRLLDRRSAEEPFSVAGEAIVEAVGVVEADPNLTSVGLGALPNRDGKVFLDAGYMEGKDLSFGAVADLEGFLHPIQLAQKISPQQTNNFLVAEGAAERAASFGLERADLITPRSYERYLEKKEALARCEQGNCSEEDLRLESYIGHDTVGMIALDQEGHIVAGTSTSGLFYKAAGRVGDSPCVGLGYYADDAYGAAVATGVGEEISKGVLPYRIVMAMEHGMTPQQAAEEAVLSFHKRLLATRGRADDISVVCMNTKGEVGAATNTDNFSFVTASEKSLEAAANPTGAAGLATSANANGSSANANGSFAAANATERTAVYRCVYRDDKIVISAPDEAWMREYDEKRQKGHV